MAETGISIGYSRSATLYMNALLTKRQFAEATARESDSEGCFIITEPIDVSEDQATDAPSNSVSTTVTSESGVSEAVFQTMLPTITKISNKLQTEDSFLLMQKWQGVVTQIKDDSFLATLRDLNIDSEDEEAEIFTADIAPADIPLLVKGAVFYWCIGYRDSAGQRTRSSQIRFRRLPAWSQRELDSARKEAEAIGEFLNWK